MKNHIYLNGRRTSVDQPKLSYSEIVALANGKPKLLYTIVYKCETAEGFISPRESVGVVDGMIINCGYTGGV
jgi:hypothetical protein